MLYKKNCDSALSYALFENPTAEYRRAPFGSWNAKLEKDQLLRQIEHLKAMGFGGFHMHSRTGLATEYLSDEFMEMVKACCDKSVIGTIPSARCTTSMRGSGGSVLTRGVPAATTGLTSINSAAWPS